VQQSGVWFTFATVSNDAKKFYEITSHDIDLLAMWGPITFTVTVPFFTILLSRSLRTAVLIAISLEVCFGKDLFFKRKGFVRTCSLQEKDL
jgi:hypothetical protein